MIWLLLSLLAAGALAQPPASLEQLSQQLREAPLDPDACFRVRDFAFRRNEVRLFLNEGVLIFRQPVNGVRTGAVFAATEELEDAEILLIPPTRMERRSLASFTGAPNLDEHLQAAAFLFTDGTGDHWFEELSRSQTARRSPERGVLLAEKWGVMLRNLSASLETRMLEDLSNGGGPGRGFFFAALLGKKLGNFDVFFDPRAREELLVGQLQNLNGKTRYNYWAHFEPKRPQPRQRPEPAARITNFAVNAQIDDQLHFRAQVKIRLEARAGGLRVLPLDVSPRMRILSARWNGEPARVFQREALRANLLRSNDSEGFLVEPARPLAGGETGELEVEQEGDIFVRAGNGVFYLATRANWFPQLDFQAAPFQATFTHPKNLNLVCPGQRTVAEEGRRTECRVDRPLRLFGFNLGEFASASVKRNNFEVEVFANRNLEPRLAAGPVTVFLPNPIPQPGPGQRRRLDQAPVIMTTPPPPPNPLSRMPAMAGEIADALEFFTGLFGPPPLNRIVAAPIPGAFGQGFPGFLYLSTLAYLEDRNLPAAERAEWQGRHFREILQAHELAHQWWGNWITFENYRDEWLSEALANYSALLYLEKRRGVKAVETVLEEYRRRLLATSPEGNEAEAAGPVVLGMRLRQTDPVAWHALTYGKTTWILHMLRGRLGDAAFFQLLGQLARDYADKPLTTEDLRRAAAAHLPAESPDRELVNFFETWVYGTGIPQLDFVWNVAGAPNRKVVTLRLRQSRVSEDFAIDIPVEIQLPQGRKIVRWLRTGAEEETLEVRTPATPLKVTLDPRQTVLRR